jgi:hypothetical protein
LAAGLDASPVIASPTMPARQLQAMLDARVSDPTTFAGQETRWSPRRMLAVAVLASGLLWGVISAGAYLLVRGL